MVEVTQADREAAASALDMNPNSMTWERLTAAHRTPTQIWQANRVAQAFAAHRIAERERCARVAEDWTMDWTRESAHIPSDIAQAIRITQ